MYRINTILSLLQVIQLLTKLHQNWMVKNGIKDSKGPNGTDNTEMVKGRKPNFFERKRFLNYEKTSDSGDEKDGKEADNKNNKGVTKEIKNGNIVESKDSAAKPAAAIEVLDEVQSKPAAKKSKPEPVRSAAPPKKDDKAANKKDVKQKTEESYSDDWGDNDNKNKNPVKPTESKKADKKGDDFFNVKDDPILDKKAAAKKEEDFFKGEFDDLDFENEFQNNMMNDQKKNNPFGQSITKEVL